MNEIIVDGISGKEKGPIVNGANDRKAYLQVLDQSQVLMSYEEKVATRLDNIGVANYILLQ